MGYESLSQVILSKNVQEIDTYLNTPEGKSQINNTNPSALEVAVLNNCPDKIIQLLITSGANVDQKDTQGRTLQDVAINLGYTRIAYLLGLHSKNRQDPNEAFLLACRNGDVPVIQYHKHVSANQTNKEDGMTPLLLAIKGQHVEAVKFLLEQGANVHPDEQPDEVEDFDGYKVRNEAKPRKYITPINQACKTGNMELIDLLVRWGAKIGVVDDETSPLHIAVEQRNKPLIDYLLARGHSLSVTDKMTHGTPLHQACRTGDRETVEKLILHGASLEYRYRVLSPLHVACASRNMEAVECLVSHGAVGHPGDDNISVMHEACKGGDINIVKYLLDKNFALNVTNKWLQTPLHIAMNNYSKPELIELLCERGSSLSVKNSYAVDLMNRIQKNNLDQSLINARTQHGDSALHLACENRKESKNSIVSILLKYNANVNLPHSKTGDTPLHISCATLDLSIVRLLIQHNANVNATNKDGIRPIHKAAQNEGGEVLSVLLENGAEINAKDTKDGSTALHVACKAKNRNMVKALVEKGASFDVTLNDGNTPLINALMSSDLDTAKFLIECGASIHTANKYGKTLLMIAASYGMFDFAKYLITEKLDVNRVQTDGITAILMAVRAENLQMTELLLKSKADPNIPDHEGKTPLYHAAMKDNIRLAELLAHHGAVFGDPEGPAKKSYYGAKTLKDIKKTDAGKAAQKIIKSRPKQKDSSNNNNNEKPNENNKNNDDPVKNLKNGLLSLLKK